MDRRNVSLLSGFIEMIFWENCEADLRSALMRGIQGHPYDLVIGGGSVFNPCLSALYDDEMWPDMKYLSIGSGTPKERHAVVTLDSYHTAYIHGYICASATQSSVIGYIISTRERSGRSVSAFVMGAKRAKSGVTVILGIINNVIGPIASRKAAEVIAREQGVDCLANQISNMGSITAMKELGLYSNGYGVDARIWSDDPNVLASSVWNLYPSALPAYEMLVNESWQPFWHSDLDFRDGIIELTSLSPVIAPLREDIRLLGNSIRNGSNRIFCGPEWENTEYGKPENMEYTATGDYCMKEAAVKAIKGFPSNFTVTGVEYFDAMGPIELKYIRHGDRSAIIAYALTTIVLLGMLINFIHVIVYRNHPTYVAASPLFLSVALFGLILTMIAHYFRVGMPTPTTCMLRPWLGGIGFSICTACITARLWRVWKTHSSSSLRGARIQMATLIPKFLAGFLAVQLAILLIFTFLDPLRPLLFSSSTLKYDEMSVLCRSTSPRRFGFTLWSAFTGFTLVPVATMVFLGRRAKREYTDSLPTIVLMYFLVGIILVSVIGVWGPPATYLTYFGLEYITMLASVGIWLALIAPKVYATHKSAKSEESSALALASFSAPRFSSQVRQSSIIPRETSYISEQQTSQNR
jgi:basic membrane lipoprotein Med (substrate-binding protein (PBP1-ABC) superfamily)